jgi:hypothetical protein
MEEEADCCIVVGFSFRDDHLNEIFEAFLKRKKQMAVISPTCMNDFYRNLLHGDPSN